MSETTSNESVEQERPDTADASETSEPSEASGSDNSAEIPEGESEDGESKDAGPESETSEAPVEEDFRDKYLRAIADLENFRMRTRREKANWTSGAVRGMAVDLVDILDNLNLALTTSESNDVANDETFLRGVKAVRDQLTNSLAQRGIKAIEVKVGDTFDADCHEVLLSQDDPEASGQKVGLVLRGGYKLDKQVLRPAQIQIIRGGREEE